MSTSRTAGIGGSHLRGERGISLVETMIALFAAVVVGVGLYMIFNATQKSSISQRLRNDVQTNCTFALDRMKNEIALGGYRAINAAQPISNAAGGTITFEYWDDNATFSAPYATGYDNHTRVTYRRATAPESGGINAGDLVREFTRYNTATDAYESPTKQVLVDNVQALGFNYFQSDNQVWSGVNLGAIRTVRVALTCESSREDPVLRAPGGGPYRPTVTLTAEVRARNVGVSETPKDTTPPAIPTGVLAWDPGTCGTLQVRWDANTDADLEGYILYTGLATGAYSRRIRLPRAPRAPGQREYYTLTGLTSAKTTDVTPPQYYIALQAFDKAGNLSATTSAAATGNPPTSARTESAADSGGSDTTIHPLLPTPPTGFTAVATPSVDGSVTLAWTAPAVAELAGYRVYRGTSAGFVPNDTPVTGNRIADEVLLPATAVSFTDTGTGLPENRLVGCQTYFYRICPIICDPTLVSSYTAAQYADASAVPTDTTPPINPIITARPGYRRIILTLTNPTRSGPGSDPDFARTTVHWSKVTFPTVGAEPNAVSPSPMIPRSGGTFTGTGTLPTINFNDETSPTATAPNLSPDTTYFFLAVAYDLCGNHSPFNSASIAEGTQCGDCLMPAPAPPGTPDPACYEAPSGQQPTGLDADGCYGYVNLSWNPIDDIVIRDFQGFRIQRREGASWVGGTNEVNLTGDDAAWLATFQDASVEEGKRYSYRVMATDCYYEQHHGKAPCYVAPCSPTQWPEPGNDPDDNFREAFLNDVAVGRPLFDPARPEVLTGSLADAPPVFHHNPVSFFIRNASDTRLTLQTLSARWDNPETWLQRIVVGDGDTTPVTVAFDDTANPLTHGAEGSTITLAPLTRLEALDGEIPFQNVFLNADRGLSRTADMRTSRIDYTLAYKNDSTGTEGCNVSGSVYAPLGPYVYSVTQDQPYFGTLGWPVPGDQGFNAVNAVTASGGVDVTVYAEVLDASLAGISAGDVRLYYYVDGTRALTEAPAVTGTYPSLNYTAVTMTRVAGDQWRGTIPAVAEANVWYFIVAQDAQSNFDRDPEPWAGAYQYYQPPPDNCATIPNPPAIAGTAGGGNVTLTWTPATTNATPSGAAYTDAAGYKVWRNRDGGAWALQATITNPATLTWTDSAVADLDTYLYRYYVTSIDQCTPTPNESAASNIYTETAEGICGNTPSPPVLDGYAAEMPDRVALTWVPPTTNAPPSISPLVDLAGFQVWRRVGPTGGWSLLASYGAGTTSHLDDTASNIKNTMYSYYVTAFDLCSSPGPNVSAPSNIYTEPIVNNPCDETPNPAVLAGSADATSVTLTWTPPTHNTNGEIFQDAGGYRVWRSRDGGGFSHIATTDSATYGYTDATVATDIGTSVYRYYVTVIDICATPNESAPSNDYTENYTGPCGTTPSPPSLSGASAASGVTLSWTAPTTNTDGSSYSDPGGYRVYRRRTTTGSWAQLGADLDVGTLSYADTSIGGASGDIGTVDYYYYVTAIDSCSPTRNESAASSVYSESYTDPCAPGNIPTPVAPGTLTLTAGGNCSATKVMDLSWGPSATAPDGYRVYGCSQADGTTTCTCTPTSRLNNDNLTDPDPDPQTQTTFTHSISTKMESIVWCYQVKAVNKGSCTNPSLYLESAAVPASPAIDLCP